MRRMKGTALVVWLAAASARAETIDVHALDYVDVVETADGSAWVGALVEQVPGDHYKLAMADGSMRVIKGTDVVKITKQKNPTRRAPEMTPAAAQLPLAMFTCAPVAATSPSVAARAEAAPYSEPPYVRAGIQLEPSASMVFPIGDISSYQATYAPEVRAGYETLYGPLGLTAGGLVRYTYWDLPPGTNPHDAAWTLETHAYGQATYHLPRAAFYAGTALGLDTNYIYVTAPLASMGNSKTTAGFGMNLFAGIELDSLPDVAIRFGFDYHPGTDTIISGAPGSVSYVALTGGALVRL